jgi:hypothetical protein
MKRTIKVWQSRREETTIEVEFPIYRKHDLMVDEADNVIYYRWDADDVVWHVQRIERGRELEFEIGKESAKSYGNEGADYVLGRGKYQCTAEEFNKVLAEASAFLAQIKP